MIILIITIKHKYINPKYNALNMENSVYVSF